MSRDSKENPSAGLKQLGHQCSRYNLHIHGIHMTFIFQKQLPEFAFTEPLVTFQGETGNKVKAASPKSPTTALNESLVECPKCSAQYPATEHRDLLVHVEYCSE